MSLIVTTQVSNGVTKLSLNMGRGNPLTPTANQELLKTLQHLATDPPRALLLDAQGSKIFSGGFALPIIASFEREELRSFLNTFMACIDQILRLPCPSVCAVSGHAVAAGFILSLATDFRVVSEGSVKLGLPEVNLGMPVPTGAQALFVGRSSESFAHRYCSTGELFTADEGYRIGYADQLASNADESALELAQHLADKPGLGLSTGRSFLTHTLADKVKHADDTYMDSFLDAWFIPETQALIHVQANKLSGRS
jgi:enoyl-CoA hydratase/carnithine racemase